MPLAALALLLAGGAAWAAGPPAPLDDTQDVLFLGAERPLLLRLHLRSDGRPAVARWYAFVGGLFDFLDRNGDGVLDQAEAARAPAPFQVQQLLQGYPSYSWTPTSVVLAGMDTNGDGVVTRAEFLSYYRRSTAGPIHAGPGAVGLDGSAAALTAALFAALDTNKDGKLSRAELKAAPAILRRFDSNDDEMISGAELLNSPQSGSSMMAPPPGMGRTREMGGLVLVERGAPGRRVAGPLWLARTLLSRYDRNGDGKLERDEIGLPRSLFKRLDVNRDGKLDVLELMRWMAGPPELELVVDVGKVPLVAALPGRGGKTSRAVRQVSHGVLDLRTPGTVLTVARAANQSGRPAAVARGYVLSLFRDLGGDRKGYVTREQARTRGQPYLYGISLIADRDGDGKLTEQELKAWLDLVEAAGGCQTALNLTYQGRGLFGLLDSDGDGRLSVRELRNAWSRLADKADEDDCISRKDLPRQYQLTIHRANAYTRFFAEVPALRGALSAAGPAPGRGPLWFRKMDRNGDGDVSPAEWLGTPEEFRRIDTDGDGLISVEEAERYDKLMRKARAARKE
jgi:Ca2+-binding EF-hand superfamily protein